MKVQITLVEHGKSLPPPSYATVHSAGMDLYAAIERAVTLNKGQRLIVPTGIAISLPEGYEAQIRPRSGLAAKHGITVLNSPGTIDADYRGEIKVIMFNTGSEDFTIEPGMRIAQMVIAKYEKIEWDMRDELDVTSRGHEGFGSTGIRG